MSARSGRGSGSLGRRYLWILVSSLSRRSSSDMQALGVVHNSNSQTPRSRRAVSARLLRRRGFEGRRRPRPRRAKRRLSGVRGRRLRPRRHTGERVTFFFVFLLVAAAISPRRLVYADAVRVQKYRGMSRPVRQLCISAHKAAIF